MSHPDSAFRPDYYCAPEGVPGDLCRHSPRRQRSGPTSRRRSFMILVDSCGWCARILRTHEPISWRQYDWVRRWNRGIERNHQ